MEIDRIVSFCRASRLKNCLNMATIGSFGVDIDSRDTTQLIKTAGEIKKEEIDALEPRFYTIQSFPGIASDYSTVCFAQSMMLEDGHGTSNLGDFNTSLATLLLTKLSNERVYYGDFQHVDNSNNEIKIIYDGVCPPSLAGKLGPAGFSEHGIPTEGEAGGLSVKLVCKVGEGVIAGLGRAQSEFQMVIAPVSIFEPPADMVENWKNEYACLGYGTDLLPALADFCGMTGIKAVLP